MRISKRSSLLVAAVVAGCAATTVQATDRQAKRNAQSTPKATFASALSDYSVLSSDSSPAIALSDRVANTAEFMAEGKPFEAQQLAKSSEVEHYAFETSERLCALQVLASGGGGGLCVDDARGLAHGLIWRTYVEDSGWRVSALLPDGVIELRLVWSDGAARRVPVVRNLASAHVTKAPASLQWIAADGRKTVERFAGLD